MSLFTILAMTHIVLLVVKLLSSWCVVIATGLALLCRAVRVQRPGTLLRTTRMALPTLVDSFLREVRTTWPTCTYDSLRALPTLLVLALLHLPQMLQLLRIQHYTPYRC